MADLKFVDQHNMVACLEKSDENAEFHQIVDFLSTCSINYALTVSPTIYASYIEQFWNTATSKIINSVKQIHAIVDGKAVVISESSVRSDLLFNDEDGVTCLTNDEIFENLALMGYEQLSTKLTFQKAQDSDNIIRTQTTAMPNVDIPQGMDTCGSPRHQETMGGTLAQTRSERVLAQPNEPPLSDGHTSGSREGRMEHSFELTDNAMIHLSQEMLDLEKEKDAQAVEILTLKIRVKKLERKSKSSISHQIRRKYRQVETSSDDGLDEEDASKQGRRSDKLEPMFNDKDFDELDDYMENVKEETVDAAATGVSTVSTPVSTAGVTISTAKPRTPPTTTIVFDDEDVTIVMAQTLIKMKGQKAKEKGFAITDVEDSSRIIRPVRSITTLQPLLTIDPKYKGKGVLVEEKYVKIKMRDQELERAQQERKRQEDDTNATLAKEFDEIQAIIDADHELAVRMWLTVVLNEEETVDPKILSTKYPIVDWESQNLGNVDMEDLHVYKIIRADGNTSYHKSLSSMLRIFDRQDLVDLHRLVMKRFEDTTPEGYNLLLWGDLKVMFEPNAEDEIWSNQQDWTLISWKLYESCGVHTLLMDGTLTSFNMLVEKRYPLIKEMLQKMLNWKLEAKAESTMAFELLKFIKSQLEE
ncbi:hypothetical protein Tco_0864142 [Tanacetum coccineum]